MSTTRKTKPKTKAKPKNFKEELKSLLRKNIKAARQARRDLANRSGFNWQDPSELSSYAGLATEQNVLSWILEWVKDYEKA
jgi:hypothetical protein